MARLSALLLLLCALASYVIAASPPTFCKCTCFTNSTIIPLGPGHEPPPSPPKSSDDSGGTESTSSSLSSSSSTSSFSSSSATAASSESTNGPRNWIRSEPDHLLKTRAASSSCSQCNRAFCLKYNLPICKGAEEKDVVTMCFARDSRKDQIIVWAFLLGTMGLLGWAGAQRAMEYREKRAAAAAGGFGAGGNGGGGGGILGRAVSSVAGGRGAASSRSAGLGNPRSPRGDYDDEIDGEGTSSGFGHAR